MEATYFAELDRPPGSTQGHEPRSATVPCHPQEKHCQITADIEMPPAPLMYKVASLECSPVQWQGLLWRVGFSSTLQTGKRTILGKSSGYVLCEIWEDVDAKEAAQQGLSLRPLLNMQSVMHRQRAVALEIPKSLSGVPSVLMKGSLDGNLKATGRDPWLIRRQATS
ncbi:hypothetical protein BDP55DRAFT_638425 [Colletotrichum godetiae]|uniref:Uncharacterized protein n=1 Tax=Colletotrichum godetiae TaxID=1209918 RepID=A0AAJ0A777_9PEZI|nr:uncharacterized protein BDP55DRAFT_638425 [Colletotrichum godetiae]KAK1657804.1 hypothetical protein BDP55DRAFT_638425 [Colletotrichum godetiae]